jgi:cell division protease FtsH
LSESRTYAPLPQPFLKWDHGEPRRGFRDDEREIDIAVCEIVVKPFHRATEMLRARRADLAEGARLLLAQETGDRRSIPCDPLDRCEGSAGRTH